MPNSTPELIQVSDDEEPALVLHHCDATCVEGVVEILFIYHSKCSGREGRRRYGDKRLEEDTVRALSLRERYKRLVPINGKYICLYSPAWEYRLITYANGHVKMVQDCFMKEEVR